MACGDFLPTIRIPQFTENPFQGVMEHLCVQADFLTQVARAPRAEYSIPFAGKNENNDGFADIVSVSAREIWEIKPKNRVSDAAAEAAFYVKKANASCGLGWREGTSYRAAGRYQNPNVVFETPPGRLVAELHAWQPGPPGAVVYEWRVRGRKEQALSAYELRAARQIVANEYFPSRSVTISASDPEGPQVDVGLLPPRIAAGESSFAPLADRLLALARNSLPRFVEGGAYEISVEKSIYEKVKEGVSRAAGAARARQFRNDAQALPESLRRTSALSVGFGFAAVVGATSMAIVAGIGLVEGVVAVAVAPAAVGVPAPAGGTLIYLTAPAAKATVTTAIAAGVALLLVPTDAEAEGGARPTSPITASVPRFDLLYPAQAADAAVGRVRELDGGQWVTIAVISYN